MPSASDMEFPPLPLAYAAAAETMVPLVHSLIVGNMDPSKVDADELLRALHLDGSSHDWTGRLCNGLLQVPVALDGAACAALRTAVDATSFMAGDFVAKDSVDRLLDYQLNLTVQSLSAIVGDSAATRLLALAARFHDEVSTPGLGALPPVLAAAVLSEGAEAPAFPEPHQIFIRRYSAATRPWFPFHCDDSSLTINIALSDDTDHIGGRLIAVLKDQVSLCERAEGTATVHPSSLLHAVTRMGSGTRYSLIIFFGKVCPQAGHKLVLCTPETMDALYPEDEAHTRATAAATVATVSASRACTIAPRAVSMTSAPGATRWVGGGAVNQMMWGAEAKLS
eukprot:CAMPEP_0177394316 /NCGR_PEP_ID=MMETSP0368-20130122/55466_1 /TAXON_ID=447022 ORGANISM="Scrippsiella hangoei-like, Strain SHHI-4" /NCGR_SAMPLE_ID=MMETSP0368 /ASSEMBLY_ACC=CAM_ASM_000363 /LENGTH=337 /DNA_ID=CAMNT_0018860651 /DNA_START=36 /DNA_END=1050 /DNA_ORIENTATION=+